MSLLLSQIGAPPVAGASVAASISATHVAGVLARALGLLWALIRA